MEKEYALSIDEERHAKEASGGWYLRRMTLPQAGRWDGTHAHLIERMAEAELIFDPRRTGFFDKEGYADEFFSTLIELAIAESEATDTVQ